MKELKSLLTEIDGFKVKLLALLLYFYQVYFYFKIPFFQVSTKTLKSESLIGRVHSINRNHSNVADWLKIGNTENIFLKYRPSDLIVLTNNRLLILNCVARLNLFKNHLKFITLHDENYKVIKSIHAINREPITSELKIVVNEEKKELYILNGSKARIIVTDFELNFIKYFGSMGRGDNQFLWPNNICFKNGFLYVSDRKNKRIQKFNQNLKFIKLLELEYEPLELTVLNSELAVKSIDGTTNFYDINAFNFNRKANDVFGFNLSEIDSIFYEVRRSKEVYCYDQDGNFIEKIQLINLLDFDYYGYGKLVVFNNTLLMCSEGIKMLIKFQ